MILIIYTKICTLDFDERSYQLRAIIIIANVEKNEKKKANVDNQLLLNTNLIFPNKLT